MAFPATPLDVAVEFWIDGAWVDFTRVSSRLKCLGIGGEDAIAITRGRSAEGARVQTTSLNLRFLDEDGYLDGTNPASPYYGKINRKTLIRVTVDGDPRCVLRIVSFQPSWQSSASASAGRNLTVDIEAAGPLIEFEQGNQPLKSAAYRALTSPVNDPYRVAYWPLEEDSGATSISSPYAGHVVTYSGSLTFGGYESLSSARLAKFDSADALMFFNIPLWTNTLSQHIIMALMRFPETPLANNSVIYRMYFTGGTVDFVDLNYATGGILSLLVYAGGALVDTAALSDWSAIILDQEVNFWITSEQSGADINWRLRATTATAWATEFSDTTAGRTLGRLFAHTVGQTDISGFGYGQLIVGSNKDAFGNYVDDSEAGSFTVVGARGYDGQTAGNRMNRLSAEFGLDITVLGSTGNSQRMGPQTTDTAASLIYDCVDVDQGIFFEDRADFAIVYRVLSDLYNQAPAASMSYRTTDGAHVSPPFFPLPDDLNVKTRTIGTRDGGGMSTYTVPDNDPTHLTTQDPEDWRNGFRVVEDPVTLKTYSDDTLALNIAWRTHIRSWAGKRFPAVVTQLQRNVFTVDVAGQTLAADLVAADLGDVLEIETVGGPAWLPADVVRLIIQGTTETLGQFQREIKFVCTPAEPYEVLVVDTSGSTLVAAMTSNATTAYVATSVGPSWYKDSSNTRPFRVVAGGNAMTVPAAGVTAQTITFIAAGTAVHDANAAGTSTLAPGLPAGMTLDARQLQLIWAAIRNSGTGTVDTPTGWSVVTGTDFGNCKLLWRWYRTGGAGSATPTITFTGGVANATVSAVQLGFANASPYQAGGPTTSLPLATKATPTAATLLNGSAANVTFPALRVQRDGSVVLALGWKQDDWTSRTAISGFTEAVDVFSTLGDDQALSVDYLIQTSAADVSSLASTVTGGASAISRGVLVALRPIVGLVGVTRNINQVSTAIAFDEPVTVWSHGVNGL